MPRTLRVTDACSSVDVTICPGASLRAEQVPRTAKLFDSVAPDVK